MASIELINFGCTSTEILSTVTSTINQLKFKNQSASIGKKRLFFLVELDEIGESEAANDFLRLKMNMSPKNALENTVSVLVVFSHSELYTKTFSKKFVFLLNSMGSECIGHPVVEVIQGYANFKMWAKQLKMPLEATAKHMIKSLIERLNTYEPLSKEKLNLLVLHAGHIGKSNTLMLWEKVRERLEHKLEDRIDIKTVHVEDGQIRDCFGCSFETCTYHALGKSCFYGGFVVEELYPDIEKADYVVWVCPNYNDAISAKLMAVINRLTALYRNVSFRDKYLCGVVVSANSGNDTVAGQLIGALSINKGFRLPPHFCVMTHANAPGDILKNKALEDIVDRYVDHLFENMYKNMN